MLDDKDEFTIEWHNYTCPGCGGYREDGCATCAEYNFFYNLVLDEKVKTLGTFQANIMSVQDIHEETLRRMEAAV